MFTNKIYTGIGSRETPAAMLQLMENIGFTLAEHGWTLRSGHAPGADQAFERGCLQSSRGAMEIYLPWSGFEGQQAASGYYVVKNPEAEHVAEQFHPAWHKCSQGARKLHTRNVFQVSGADLNLASDVVICWTRDGKQEGGTGQALRIAKYLNIPIFDLAVHTGAQLLNFLNYGIQP